MMRRRVRKERDPGRGGGGRDGVLMCREKDEKGMRQGGKLGDLTLWVWGREA